MNFLYMLGIVLTCFSVFILQSFAADSSSATEESSSILQKGYTFNLTFQLDYLLFLPKSYGHAPVQKWPLIIFLHGAGERGDNLDLVKNMVFRKLWEKILISHSLQSHLSALKIHGGRANFV